MQNLYGLPETIKLYSESSTIPVKLIRVADIYNKKEFKDGNKVEINVKDLPRGTYYLHIESKSNSEKIEKMRILLQ
jgi:hypothetical protein